MKVVAGTAEGGSPVKPLHQKTGSQAGYGNPGDTTAPMPVKIPMVPSPGRGYIAQHGHEPHWVVIDANVSPF